MANTGYKGYNRLRERNLTTGDLTGNTKVNDPSDPDYIEPVYDTTYCPLPSITLSPTSYQSTGESQTFTINVTSTVDWIATSENSWMTIVSGASGSGNGTVQVQIDSNVNNIRTGNIKVEGEGITKYCGVNQDVVDNIIVNPDYLFFGTSGGQETVTVSADSNWTASGGGANIIPSSGGQGDTTVTIERLTSNNPDNTFSEVTFSLDNGQNEDILTIEQQGTG